MTGPERVMLYRLAIETGLRAGELASLTRASFDLSLDRPVVRVEAAYSKHRREDELPLRPDTAADLSDFVTSKFPGQPLFKIGEKGAAMMRADLAAARTAWIKNAVHHLRSGKNEGNQSSCLTATRQGE